MELSQALQIQQLIDNSHQPEARQALNSLGTPDLHDPLMWALAAQLAPTAETRENALRKTFDNSDNVTLANWALEEIRLLESNGVARAVSRPPLAEAGVVTSDGGSSPVKTLVSLPVVQAGAVGFLLGAAGLLALSGTSLSVSTVVSGGLFLNPQTALLGLLKISCIILLVVGIIGIAAGAYNAFTQGGTGSK